MQNDEFMALLKKGDEDGLTRSLRKFCESTDAEDKAKAKKDSEQSISEPDNTAQECGDEQEGLKA